MIAKQKIVQGRGLSNLNLGTFVCSFDVCRVSKPFLSINYGQTNATFSTHHVDVYVPHAPGAQQVDLARMP